MDFVKMEGAGNDYVYVDALRSDFPWSRAAELAVAWSDRHFGVGGDGLIVLSKGERAPVRMTMWNLDGSRGAMCGNGLRCVAKLARDHGHVATDRFVVETDAGDREVEVFAADAHDPATCLVRTQMGPVVTGPAVRIEILGRQLEFVPGDAGNPHAVVFVDDVEAADVAGIGAAMQHHVAFPDGVNVEFVQVVGPDLVRQRTFERGSGETLACGTGAAAVARAARQLGLVTGDEVRVELRGGLLRIQLDGTSLAIVGPARTVFAGTIALPGREP
ncbi:MAG: diaminopimelate epimerase [Planctomycetes bacterium]|nr:diaminopimelate epimerase [Planctomycetota bacterium]MCB9884390.1 diaminopimelate epimerase [Planctomycetota bacterium]